MLVVFHERFKVVYASNPAAVHGRMECIVEELRDHYQFVEPMPATETDLLLVHYKEHIERIKQYDLIYTIATLAAGGAIKASELAMEGEKAFALIRPPGHHASPGSCWGFCWFNNVAIAVEKLRRSGALKKALIIDIDLHYGDGTANFFERYPDVAYYHVAGLDQQDFLADLKSFMGSRNDYDLVAVSAGFDRHEKDWGHQLSTENYTQIGEIIKEFAGMVCQGRVFAVLEGGYNHYVLGKNVKALLTGLE